MKKNKKNNKDEDVGSEKEIPVQSLKVWDKEEYVQKKFSERPLEFYIRIYRFNLKSSLIISFMSLLTVFATGPVIKTQEQNHEFYITSTDGRVIEHNLSESDIREMQRAFAELRENQN